MKNKLNSRTVMSNTRRRALGSAITLALASMSAPVLALEFGEGEFNGTFDTTISYGVSMRVQDIDEDLIGMANLNPLIGTRPLAEQRAAPGRWSVNSDDGNLKYGKNDLFSNAIKITSELGLNYGEDWGAFFRASYFYDFENVDRKDLSSLARQKVGKDFKLLDAFVFHNFNIGENEGTVRLGNQVVSWGESTFIQNGINVINPIDVSKLRVAGAELKEAFLPVNSIWGSFAFNEQLSLEAIYMFEFEQTEPEPAGTYFSTNDFGSLGGEFVMLGFGTVDEPANFALCAVNPAADPRCAAAVGRLPDRFAKDSGQYGAALRYFSPELNDTEFGLYYLNYHSRLPLLSGRAITTSSPNSGRYFVEYPEDIHLYGLSWNTTLPWGIAFQGETSYRDNMPLQFDDVELLFAALSPLNGLIPTPFLRFQSQLGTFLPGQEIRGWERHEVSQLQFTLTKVFGPGNWLGAEQIAAVGEFGATNVWDFPEASTLRYQGDGTDLCGAGTIESGYGRCPGQQNNGFPTPFSWGYRLAVRADYNNAFGSAFNLSPRVAFNHDVNGITPGPGGNFIEDRKSFTLGVEGNYLNQWAADLAYTRFYGAGDLNLVSDRDFLAFTVRYSF